MDVRVLGPLEVLVEGSPLDLGPPRQRAVFARLLMNVDEATSVDRLIEDLWPGDVPDTARHTVHVYLSNLRNALGEDRDRLMRTRTGYLLSMEPHESDAIRFTGLLSDARQELVRGDVRAARSLVGDALSLWRGPAFGDIAAEAFVYPEAARLEELHVAALELRITADLELGSHDEVVEELHDLVKAHPFRERLREQLMLALYRSGRQAEALAAYQDARTQLVEELGIDPGRALQQLENQILNQDLGLDLPGHSTAGSPPTGLPRPRTTFIGREVDLKRCGEFLTESRLLTLLGPPGSGKTRIAIELATSCAGKFVDGVVFVRLAAVRDVALVDATIAKALGLHDVSGERPLDGVKEYLARRRSLLVLDNFEQVVDASSLVAEILDAAPGSTIMVTSRTPLGISGEQQYHITPLPIPPLAASLTPADIVAYDAVALFVARARASQPEFDIDSGNASDVAEITVRLDGLPLAIELAAARMKLFTPEELLRRLRLRRPTLSEGPADVEERHRTLRDAIDWSFDVLDPENQILFRRLGVFRGFTLDSATAVTGLPEESVLAGIDSLLSQSLVYRTEAGGPARFAMLETLRDFALEQLDVAGETKETLASHAAYYLRVAEWSAPELTRDSSQETVDLLSVDVDNIRGVLQHCIDSDDPDTGLYLAGHIWRFFQIVGRLLEGRQWLEALLVMPTASDEARANGLTGLAGLAYWQGSHSEATVLYEEALALYRMLGDHLREADTLFSMSMSTEADLEWCERLATEALVIFEQHGLRDRVGHVYMARAALMHRAGRHADARPLWEASLEIARELGDRQLAVTQLAGLGICAYHASDHDQALKIALDCLNEATILNNVQVAVWMLEYAAAFSVSSYPEGSACLTGVVDSLRRETGGLIPLEALGIADARSITARALSPDDRLAAISRGRSMTLQEAVDFARGFERFLPQHLDSKSTD